MVCLHPINLGGRRLPCGRCRACRIQKTNEWVIRLFHEMEYHKNVMFLTLTYREEDLPKNLELYPNDLKNFWKRIRKQIDHKIKYYACGEYGERNKRPHYHAIVFGLGVTDRELVDKCWDLGFSKVGTVTEQSIRYVASYIMDKDESINMNEFRGVTVAPFSRCSNGLGLKWINDHESKVIKDLCVKRKGIEHSIPKYYLKKLDGKVTDEMLNIRARIKSAENEEKLADIGVSYFERATYDRQFRSQKSEEIEFLTKLRKDKKSL